MPTELSKAVLAMETGEFREWTPQPFLRRHFQSGWIYRIFDAESERAAILPDGSVHLRWLDGRFSVRGPDRSARIETLRRGSLVIGFKFQPGAAARWLKGPISMFAGIRVPLEEILGTKARAIAEWAGDAKTETEIVHRVEIGLAHLAREIPSPEEEAQRMFQALDSNTGATVHDGFGIASQLGLSIRTLRRRYDELFGYGPKTLERILRFQRFLKLVRSPVETRLSDCALNAGYADQPHMNRETRRIAGLSPKTIVERLKD